MSQGSISLFRRIERAIETITLGPTPNARYEIGVADMRPGDVLVLYTDGITEATPPESSDHYGEDRLIHVAQGACHLDPVAIVDRVFTDVSEFSRTSPPTDDQTVVVIKRRPVHLEETPA